MGGVGREEGGALGLAGHCGAADARLVTDPLCVCTILIVFVIRDGIKKLKLEGDIA